MRNRSGDFAARNLRIVRERKKGKKEKKKKKGPSHVRQSSFGFSEIRFLKAITYLQQMRDYNDSGEYDRHSRAKLNQDIDGRS